MRRQERDRAKTASVTPRTLRGADFLLGVRDDIRQGAIRFREPGSGDYFSSHENAVPKVIELSRLLQAVDRYEAGGPQDHDLKALIDAGGSLGGARPKAAVITRTGKLAIAKFPRKGSDDWDVIGWEKLELNLAGKAGLNVAPSELIGVSGRNVLLVDRFERNQGRRIGFTSALTMLEASERDQRSYLEIAEVIQTKSNTVNSDLEQLYRRIVFSILTGNTDDHLRNHGFVRAGRAWTLSPAYDINPNPDSPGRLSTTIDLDSAEASIDVALSVAEDFRLSPSQARSIVLEVEAATRGWRQEAQALGLPPGEVDRMTVAFESEQRRIARAQ
jgi:serine/threonine-protein kinase HipA